METLVLTTSLSLPNRPVQYNKLHFAKQANGMHLLKLAPLVWAIRLLYLVMGANALMELDLKRWYDFF